MDYFDINDTNSYDYERTSWPAPHPSQRIDATGGTPPPLAPRRRRRGVKVAAAAVALALLGGVGYAVTNDGTSTSTRSAPATTVAPGTSPATNPGTTPATNPGTTPATNPGTTPATTNGGSEVSASTTQLSVGVVDINTRLSYQGGAAAGTGIVLTSDGEILTNNHVVDGSTSISVTIVSTGETYTAKVLGTDPTHDVALLKLENASGLDTAKLGDSDKLQVGDTVVPVGNANGDGGAPTISEGVVTALDQAITASESNGQNSQQLTGLIEMNASLQPGESGGPVYNAAAEVVGMNTAGSVSRRVGRSGGNTAGAANYAIPINTALQIADLIRTGKGSDTITIGYPGFLGVEVAANDGTTTAGAPISDVVSGTPAEKIGLQAGDVITKIDGDAVAHTDALGDLLGDHKPGDKVAVTWIDAGGATHTEDATLVVGAAD